MPIQRFQKIAPRSTSRGILLRMTQELVSPIKLDNRQQEFIRLYVETGDHHAAARAAGYSEGTIKGSVQLLTRPNIAFAISVAARFRLASKIPMALAVLEHLAEHAVSERVRMESATRLLDRAGLSPPKPADDRRDTDKPLNEMTIEEMRAYRDKLESEIGNRAQNVTPELTKDNQDE
jgi:phage terminase small subunit